MSSSSPAPDADAVTYLARRGVSPQWRGFLRAMVDTLDAQLDAGGRDALLRAVGRRLAEFTPLPACATLLDLETRANEALAAMDWGYVAYLLDANARMLVVRHQMAPRVATERDAAGAWMGPVVEGLHGGWLAAQARPQAAPRLRLAQVDPAGVTLHAQA